MILKNIKTTYNFFLLSIIIFCYPQPRTVLAATEPIINVLILKDKQIRIRSDRYIPLTIKGQRFSNKKIKGLTLKKQNNRTTLIFDKNKQKIYDLKNKEKFLVSLCLKNKFSNCLNLSNSLDLIQLKKQQYYSK